MRNAIGMPSTVCASQRPKSEPDVVEAETDEDRRQRHGDRDRRKESRERDQAASSGRSDSGTARRQPRGRQRKHEGASHRQKRHAEARSTSPSANSIVWSRAREVLERQLARQPGRWPREAFPLRGNRLLDDQRQRHAGRLRPRTTPAPTTPPCAPCSLSCCRSPPEEWDGQR